LYPQTVLAVPLAAGASGRRSGITPVVELELAKFAAFATVVDIGLIVVLLTFKGIIFPPIFGGIGANFGVGVNSGINVGTGGGCSRGYVPENTKRIPTIKAIPATIQTQFGIGK
jgi:hypothetical protein